MIIRPVVLGDYRASKLHGWRRAVQTHPEGPVLPHRREEPVLTGHHAAHPRRSLQQPRDHPNVPVSQSHHREAASDRVPVRRLCVETELRLVEALEITSQRVPSPRQSRLHGSVQPRSHHDHLQTAPGNEEAGAG